MSQKLKDVLTPSAGPERIERQWTQLSGRLRKRPLIGPWGAAAVASTALALAVALLLPPPAPRGSTMEGAELESGAAESAVALSDGSHIDLAPETRLSVETSRGPEVRLQLRRGRARFEVAPRKRGRFVVAVGDVEVTVVGTRFRVSKRAAEVEVEVEHGVVEVSQRGRLLKRLGAGEHLSAPIEPGPELSPLLTPVPAEQDPSAPGPSEEALDPSQADVFEPEEATEEPPEEAPPADRAQRPGRPTPKARVEHHPEAKALFEEANVARRSGEVRAAAASYAALVRRFPRDARSGLAAFELGRLRMDSLNDAAGAVQALKAALARGPRASFAEDALARLATAYDSLGQRADCERARQEYLRRYPDGVHKATLALRCGAH